MGMLIHHHRLQRLKQWQKEGNKKNLGTEHNAQFVADVRAKMGDEIADGPTPMKRRRGRPKKNAISNRTAISS